MGKTRRIWEGSGFMKKQDIKGSHFSSFCPTLSLLKIWIQIDNIFDCKYPPFPCTPSWLELWEEYINLDNTSCYNKQPLKKCIMAQRLQEFLFFPELSVKEILFGISPPHGNSGTRLHPFCGCVISYGLVIFYIKTLRRALKKPAF